MKPRLLLRIKTSTSSVLRPEVAHVFLATLKNFVAKEFGTEITVNQACFYAFTHQLA